MLSSAAMQSSSATSTRVVQWQDSATSTQVVQWQEPVTVIMGRADSNSMVETAKAVSDKVVEETCTGVNKSLKAAGTIVGASSDAVDPCVDSCTETTKPIVQRVARDVVESDWCYGSEESTFSKITGMFIRLFGWTS